LQFRQQSPTHLLALTALVIVSVIFYGLNSQSSKPQRPVLLFCDKFSTLSFYDGNKGTWDTTYFWQHRSDGSSLPNEDEWYLNNSFKPTSAVKPWRIETGHLALTASRTASSIAGWTEKHHYVSGMINSGHSFAHRFGYFEMRAKLPWGAGLWPAFWLVPSDGTASHEIDVMEEVGQNPRTLYTTLHVFRPEHEVYSRRTIVADMTRSFHAFGVDWERDEITWYFDHNPVFQVRSPHDLNKPMFMIVNLAVGGPMPGYPDDSTPFPSAMLIDYIRVYSSYPRFDPPASVEESCEATRAATKAVK
jgi:beta-glucanase (GH16 family)